MGAARTGDFAVVERIDAARVAFVLEALCDPDRSPLGCGPQPASGNGWTTRCAERILELLPSICDDIDPWRELYEEQEAALRASRAGLRVGRRRARGARCRPSGGRATERARARCSGQSGRRRHRGRAAPRGRARPHEDAAGARPRAGALRPVRPLRDLGALRERTARPPGGPAAARCGARRTRARRGLDRRPAGAHPPGSRKAGGELDPAERARLPGRRAPRLGTAGVGPLRRRAAQRSGSFQIGNQRSRSGSMGRSSPSSALSRSSASLSRRSPRGGRRDRRSRACTGRRGRGSPRRPLSSPRRRLTAARRIRRPSTAAGCSSRAPRASS